MMSLPEVAPSPDLNSPPDQNGSASRAKSTATAAIPAATRLFGESLARRPASVPKEREQHATATQERKAADAPPREQTRAKPSNPSAEPAFQAVHRKSHLVPQAEAAVADAAGSANDRTSPAAHAAADPLWARAGASPDEAKSAPASAAAATAAMAASTASTSMRTFAALRVISWRLAWASGISRHNSRACGAASRYRRRCWIGAPPRASCIWP